MSEISDDVLDAVERALRDATSVALTIGPCLSEPYVDDPRWTPNTRWLEPMGKRALAARMALTEARRALGQFERDTDAS